MVWSREFVPLPQGRTNITKNGTLIITNFGPLDSGTYQCKASNKLGSVNVLTTLHYNEQGQETYVFNFNRNFFIISRRVYMQPEANAILC